MVKPIGGYSPLPVPQKPGVAQSGKAKKPFQGGITVQSQIKAMTEHTQNKVINQHESSVRDLDFWGAEATAKRILDFAQGLAGEDRGKISMLRDAVIEGFRQAEAILGGLPEVSRETYRLVMEGFDQWEKGSFEGKA